MKKWPYIFTILFLCSLPCILVMTFGVADNMKHFVDYTMTFVIPFPPSKVRMTTNTPEKRGGYFSRYFCEGYNTFYFDELSEDAELTFSVSSEKSSFEFTLEKPSQLGETLYTIDLSNQQVYEGYYPYRTVILVAIRVGIFMALEAILLWIIGFKQKRNWVIILGLTLISQTLFNYLQGNPMIEDFYEFLFMTIRGLIILASIETITFFFVVTDEGNNRRIKLFLFSNLLRVIITALMIFG
ncbi:hypothetical protein JR338_05900 [Chloroflexota bacterium]|nr:hypothetical protein JR338_05900 [Chloroflexota bacterium]